MAYNPGYAAHGQQPFCQGQYPHPSGDQNAYQYPMGQNSHPNAGLNYQQPIQTPQNVQGQYQMQPQLMAQMPYAPQQSMPYPPTQSAPHTYQAQHMPSAPQQASFQPPYVPQHNPPTSQVVVVVQGACNKEPPFEGQKKTRWVANEQTKYTGQGIPDEDVSENDPEEKICDSAPKYDLIVPGYEKMGSKAPFETPPSYEESLKEAVPALVDVGQVPGLSAESARHALVQLVASQACWGKKAARKMDIKDIQANFAYHYVLETFTEARTTKFSHAPYKGGIVDSPHVGPAPLPWNIPCRPKTLFKNEEQKIPVPHTEVVRPCHLCQGRGYNRCAKCRGRGKVLCGTCNGKGKVEETEEGETVQKKCEPCGGKGRKCCKTCTGAGCVQCVVCSGYGSVKHFIQLIVTYTNHHDYHVRERSDLPDHLIRHVQGDTIFQQTALRVRPVENFFEGVINQKSKELVERHGRSWQKERILQQKHFLRAVPVHECLFEFHEKLGRFWVYGNDRHAYTNDYPHTCCCCRCGCSIL